MAGTSTSSESPKIPRRLPKSYLIALRFSVSTPQGLCRAYIAAADSSSGIASASPLSAFIRVPLSWYHSRTFPFHADETQSGIRRVYSHPAEQHVIRHFCGFCGTPLSYWSETPSVEADYIRLTVGSLLTDDLHELEDMGLVPADPNIAQHPGEVRSQPSAVTVIPRNSDGIPWFETMLAGSVLGNIQTRRVEAHNGRIRVEWEVTEWTEGTNENDEDADMSEASDAADNKRKRGDADDGTTGTSTERRIM